MDNILPHLTKIEKINILSKRIDEARQNIKSLEIAKEKLPSDGENQNPLIDDISIKIAKIQKKMINLINIRAKIKDSK